MRKVVEMEIEKEESANKNLGGEKKKKMKTKIVVLVGIALCTMLLISPALANGVDTLGVYGNANEDDTIDMRDLTYVKLIFFGKKPETELADAKYDGKINPLDFIQIKLIIVGKEKELTVVQYIKYLDPSADITEEPVTVPMPIDRIVVTSDGYGVETLCALEAQDRIVGVTETAKRRGELKTFVEDKPLVGKHGYSWDIEMILERNPDIVLAYAHWDYSKYEETLNAAGIPLVQMDLYRPEKYSREVRNLGWMLSKQERAEELINFEQQYLDLIEERVEDLEEEQKTRVYAEFYREYRAMGSGSSTHAALIACGGINIFADMSTSYFDVDPEEVVARNPQVILRVSGFPAGYDVTDTGPMEELRNDIMSRPAWDSTDAVKNGSVYLISTDTKSTHSSVFHSYMAKWFYPDLFEDIDPVAIHEEWFEKFLGIEYQGVYAYPTYPVS